MRSVLTILGGKVVHGEGDYAPIAPQLPKPMPDWSPGATFGGYYFEAGTSDSDIFNIDRTDPVIARSARKRCTFSFSPNLAIILNASAAVTPMHGTIVANRRCQNIEAQNGGWLALAVGEKE